MIKIPFQSIREMYRSCLLAVLPYSLALASLYILIEPKTKPTFSDTTDWMALSLFILGLFAVCVLHSCIIYQIIYSLSLNGNNDDKSPELFSTLKFGFKKMFPVFFMGLCYAILVGLGLIALIIPGIFLFIVGSLSLFIIVLKDTNPKNAFIESYKLLAPKWMTVGITFLSIAVVFTLIETLIALILKEQVVFATLFSVLVRGFLWPIIYVTLITFYSAFSIDKTIVDSPDLISLYRNRKQKFLRTAPNQ